MMSRGWVRLVSFLSLAAFLGTNTPGSVAAMVRFLESRQDHVCQHKCCHSCCHEGISEPTSDTHAALATTMGCSQFDTPDLIVEAMPPEERDEAPCQSCPCSNGTCAHCSVAKALCFSAASSPGIAVPCFGQAVTEDSLLIPSAYCGELIRPPID